MFLFRQKTWDIPEIETASTSHTHANTRVGAGECKYEGISFIQLFSAVILALGSDSPYNKKAELYSRKRNAWDEIADYPGKGLISILKFCFRLTLF